MGISEKKQKEYYQAFLNRDSTYDGIFFIGIKTTGIFCHATCSARKPKFENCDFFNDAESALIAGYRPCKKCLPLSFPGEMPEEVRVMVEAVEQEPEKRWTEKDFEALGMHSATARRKFKQFYGMTFVQYARSRRMGLAFSAIRKGQKVIDNQLEAGYESSSGFHDAFTKIMGDVPSKAKDLRILFADWFNTPLGPMVSVADDDFLYLLEFADRRALEREIERLRKRMKVRILPGKTKISQQIAEEMGQYFTGNLRTFKTPLFLSGTPFQQKVWQALTTIPYGETKSYKDLAQAVGIPTGYRAIGNANGANQLAIIIPCHRVVKSSGELGGYGGKPYRKEWLLNFEKGELDGKGKM
ncbi:bifunctional transcriptional activator/DNA repair enzyme AdaA [Vagococcus elongatus]|uniref:methylated-DNA--[protein]-cysteine S-methyltransferase n=1 Tax=Vagococcus elongatus TaxID=180344 RepID=A0A430B1V3_9ENTE|nr:trifunctional transcriptional activator/DNA repair protein Ada/methylated-DNA--[protein]-cysteine S-methyltransferase [Vagococcus elongatus]RSU14288.1 bifunctional transcriptional activator/DNA repair enzyme protein Ada [Vagococcus elongatus]